MPDVSEDKFTTLAVVYISRMDHDSEEQAGRVNKHMPLATTELFVTVIASWTALFSCFSRLAVDDGTARFRFTPALYPKQYP